MGHYFECGYGKLTRPSAKPKPVATVALPRSLFIFRVIARNLIVAAHNVVIIPVVFCLFDVGVNANILWLADRIGTCSSLTPFGSHIYFQSSVHGIATSRK